MTRRHFFAPSTKTASVAIFSVMSITAVIEKGMVKIPSDIPWASGTVVRIEPVDERPSAGGQDSGSLADCVASLAGIGSGAHSDLSTNKSHLIDFGR